MVMLAPRCPGASTVKLSIIGMNKQYINILSPQLLYSICIFCKGTQLYLLQTFVTFSRYMERFANLWLPHSNVFIAQDLLSEDLLSAS